MPLYIEEILCSPWLPEGKKRKKEIEREIVSSLLFAIRTLDRTWQLWTSCEKNDDTSAI
jgi:hypothetical protein